MATYRRAPVEGGTYFFTVCTYRRDYDLTAEPIGTALRNAFRAVRSTHPFTLDAIVLLPDHLHCIWTLPEGDADFSMRSGLIKRLTSRAAKPSVRQHVSSSRAKRHESGLWQRRFWEHQIRDEADFARHVDYIHWNPVKHRHVTHVAAWPYSSFHRFVRLGILPRDWATDDLDGDFGEGG